MFLMQLMCCFQETIHPAIIVDSRKASKRTHVISLKIICLLISLSSIVYFGEWKNSTINSVM